RRSTRTAGSAKPAASARCSGFEERLNPGGRGAAARTAIGVDLGGTKIAAFRVREDGSIEDRAQRPTPGEAEAIIQSIHELATEVRSDDVVAVGIGAPGMVEFDGGILRYAPNIPLRDLPLSQRLSGSLGLPCLLDNDANVAAWGEYRFGAGRDATDML